MNADAIQIALGALQDILSSTAFVLFLFIDFCVVFGFTKTKKTAGGRATVVKSLDEHPLPQLVAAGAQCSINTDDPAMFNTDLGQDYAAAAKLGVTSDAAFEAGLHGALIDDLTRNQLRALAAD